MKRINILYVVLSTESTVELTIVCADLDMANIPYSRVFSAMSHGTLPSWFSLVFKEHSGENPKQVLV